MTKIAYFNLQQFIRQRVLDVSLSKKASSIALGICIGRRLPIPSAAAENGGASFYADHGSHAAAEIASEFNENVVVDLDLVLETARTYWMIRYTNAYPDLCTPISTIGEVGFLAKISGCAHFINEETLAFADTHCEVMVVLVNRINAVLNECGTNADGLEIQQAA